jgi:hypothetical protein
VTPIVSIVIATKNRAQRLRRSFDSLSFIKSSVPWEVVVVDNGSTDETLLRGATTQGGAVGEPRTLVKEGFAVSASILAWSPPHRRVLDLVDRGIDIWFRPQEYFAAEASLA